MKEDEMKEIYRRNLEHQRLWNETESLFNAHYAVGKLPFSVSKSCVYGRILKTLGEQVSIKSIKQ